VREGCGRRWREEKEEGEVEEVEEEVGMKARS